MSAIKIIEESIIQVQKRNIRICRGPLYIWGSGDVPEACDCFGAVLVSRDKAYKNFPKGWLKELLVDILDKDILWFYKFNYGFSQRRALDAYREDTTKDDGDPIWIEEKISKSAIDLAKKLNV